jgi:ABC-type dipeptide/oligopeptide/nickel transport system ATPase component
VTVGEQALLEVEGLCADIGGRRVVDGVGLSVAPGECVGIVGESGSGKSLTLRSVIGLLPRGARQSAGELRFDGAAYRPEELRGHGIAMVFQEPMTALNPTRRAVDLIADGVLAGRRERVSRWQAREIAVGLMGEVGIPEPAVRARAFPHELSGGLRQRVMIAMALSGSPRLLLCDEPTTALDVTVQDQILGLLDRLREERGLGLLFVTHDLAVIAQVSQRVAVMYDGRLVEQGRTADVLARPEHEHTAALRAAAAAVEGGRTEARTV